jgi:hypothetical protein
MHNLFFVALKDGMWVIRSGNEDIGGSATRAEAIDFAIRKATVKGFATQVLVAGKDHLFQTVWAGGRSYYQ